MVDELEDHWQVVSGQDISTKLSITLIPGSFRGLDDLSQCLSILRLAVDVLQRYPSGIDATGDEGSSFAAT